jgi:hypothetical protein
MLDIIAVLSLAAMFALGLVYVHGCDRLKGKRHVA